MIVKNLIFIIFFFILSCSNIEFVVKDNNKLKNKTYIIAEGNESAGFTRELYYFFGNNKNFFADQIHFFLSQDLVEFYFLYLDTQQLNLQL